MRPIVDLALETKLQQKLGPMIAVSHRSEVRFNCPFCEEDHDWHLYIGYRKNRGWICHRCGTSGGTIDSLLQRLGITREKHAGQWHAAIESWLAERQRPYDDKVVSVEPIPLPPKFVRLIPDLEYLADLPHFKYLTDVRGIDRRSIREWQIGVSKDEKFANRLVLPDPHLKLDDKGRLVTEYWVARGIYEDMRPPYLNPDGTSSRLHLFNIARPRQFTVIVEGVFDVYGTGTHAVALFGKNCSSVQLSRLVEEGTPPFYVALDHDALIYCGRRRGKRNILPGAALALAESLYVSGKEVHLCFLPEGHDPGDLGPDRMYRICEQAELYTPEVKLAVWIDALKRVA